jgi:transcriptional regulator NrdR family protein
MPCPQCGGRTDVYDSRLNTQNLIRRRRACRACDFRFATIEVMNEYQPLGKKEKPDAPIPKVVKPKPEPKPRPEPKPVKEKVRRSVERSGEKPRGFDEDIVPWTDDADDFSSYIDLPRGFNDD